MLTALLWLAPPSARDIETALETTRIPKLSLEDALYTDAAAVVMQHLYTVHPELRGVRFATCLPDEAFRSSTDRRNFNPKITVDLTDTSAHMALRYVSNMASLEYAVRDGVIYFYAPTSCSGVPPPLTVQERFTTGANRVYWRVRDTFNSK